MGQIMAECDCPREADCQAAQRCLAEKQDDLVKRLRAVNAYKAPDFSIPFVEPIKAEAADRIEALGREKREAALDALAAHGQAHDSYEAQLKAEARLAKAVEAMREAVKTWEQPHYGDMDTALDHGGEAMDLIRAVLAEIEGGKKDE
jgi:hypothetical protein